jgi:hypothetical protein
MREPAPSTVERFIWLVEKVEARHPNWSAQDTAHALRQLARYDSTALVQDIFQDILGQDGHDLLTEAKRNLSNQYGQQLRELRGMLQYDTQHDIETGIVKDATGQEVAVGHVITGLVAGLLNPHSMIGQKLTTLMGQKLDKIGTVTLAVDLGQAAFQEGGGVNPANPFGGIGPEATAAELRGDIDGTLLATFLTGTREGQALRADMVSNRARNPESIRLSTVLREYYHPSERTKISLSLAAGSRGGRVQMSAQSRHNLFSTLYWSKNAQGNTPFRQRIIDQTAAFHQWYASRGDTNPFNVRPADFNETQRAITVFETWLEQQPRRSTRDRASLTGSLAGAGQRHERQVLQFAHLNQPA